MPLELCVERRGRAVVGRGVSRLGWPWSRWAHPPEPVEHGAATERDRRGDEATAPRRRPRLAPRSSPARSGTLLRARIPAQRLSLADPPTRTREQELGNSLHSPRSTPSLPALLLFPSRSTRLALRLHLLPLTRCRPSRIPLRPALPRDPVALLAPRALLGLQERVAHRRPLALGHPPVARERRGRARSIVRGGEGAFALGGARASGRRSAARGRGDGCGCGGRAVRCGRGRGRGGREDGGERARLEVVGRREAVRAGELGEDRGDRRGKVEVRRRGGRVGVQVGELGRVLSRGEASDADEGWGWREGGDARALRSRRGRQRGRGPCRTRRGGSAAVGERARVRTGKEEREGGGEREGRTSWAWRTSAARSSNELSGASRAAARVC